MGAGNWKVVIGLEIHCQLKTHSKMFSPCGYTAGQDPNTQTDPYTLGLPGTLPVPNRQVVEYGIATHHTVQRGIHSSPMLP